MIHGAFRCAVISGFKGLRLSRWCFQLLTGFLIVSAFLGSAFSAEQPAPKNVFSNLQNGKPQTVIVYGTSLTVSGEWANAMRLYFDQHYPGLVTFTNAAQAGQQSNWGAANLEKRVLSKKPDLVFLEFAINDANQKHKITPARSIANLDAMVQALRKQNPQIDIVLQTMNPAWDAPDEPSQKKYGSDRPHLVDYYDAYRAYAAQQNLPLVDNYPAWRKLQESDEITFQKWLPDGIHPTPQASMAVTWPAIEALLDRARIQSISIIYHGAIADGKTVNTKAIQSVIDNLAITGGGTVVVPPGVFVSGALFFKPGVNLRLEKDSVLRCSTDMANFPEQRTRIEGHFEERFNPALINADHCDGFHITGEGTLDGAGRPIWDEFWTRRKASADKANFRNLSVPRARLALIENSRDVVIDGVTFKDSQFWNLHLYRCSNIRITNARFVIPDDYNQAPSSDGIDVDSCQDIMIQGCYFSVTDDCIALKGSKGPLALTDKDSPPVENVRIVNCVFQRGHAALTLGSEATLIRDVVMENAQVLGAMPVLHLKLRPDTPQHYEDIHIRGLVLDSTGGQLISAKPWTQYANLQGQPAPKSIVRNITVSNVSGHFGSLMEIQANPGQTEISDIALENINVQLKTSDVRAKNVKNLSLRNVVVNGKSLAKSTED